MDPITTPVKLCVITDKPVPLCVADNSIIPLDVSMEIREIQGDYPFYPGPYVVDPKFEDQILETKDTTLTADIQVNAIMVSRTTNPSGGNTVYIGGIINA